MPVFKATMTVTFLFEANSEEGANAAVAYVEPETVIDLMTTGDWIGGVKMSTAEEIPGEKVKAELQAIGNDGEFFDLEDV
jgi:hypothetical protein